MAHSPELAPVYAVGRQSSKARRRVCDDAPRRSRSGQPEKQLVDACCVQSSPAASAGLSWCICGAAVPVWNGWRTGIKTAAHVPFGSTRHRSRQKIVPLPQALRSQTACECHLDAGQRQPERRPAIGLGPTARATLRARHPCRDLRADRDDKRINGGLLRFGSHRSARCRSTAISGHRIGIVDDRPVSVSCACAGLGASARTAKRRRTADRPGTPVNVRAVTAAARVE